MAIFGLFRASSRRGTYPNPRPGRVLRVAEYPLAVGRGKPSQIFTVRKRTDMHNLPPNGLSLFAREPLYSIPTRIGRKKNPPWLGGPEAALPGSTNRDCLWGVSQAPEGFLTHQQYLEETLLRCFREPPSCSELFQRLDALLDSVAGYCRKRQLNGCHSAAALPIAQMNFPTVGITQLLDDRQAQPAAAA